MNRWIALLPLAVGAGLVGLFFARVDHDPRYTPDALVGRPAPAETLPALQDGQAETLASAAPPGTLVNFFASWCGPCQEEAPTLLALKAQGVRIVGVAWKDDPVQTRAMLARSGDPYALTLVDRDGRAGLDFGVSGVPETYLIGPGGKIIAKYALPLTPPAAEALLEKGEAPG
jgi:cytochrome c biogenesis protein CcmG/thiol:disulfide interchange protein DsbE